MSIHTITFSGEFEARIMRYQMYLTMKYHQEMSFTEAADLIIFKGLFSVEDEMGNSDKEIKQSLRNWKQDVSQLQNFRYKNKNRES